VEATTRASVDITFLHMTKQPASPAPDLPDDAVIAHVPKPEPLFYRYLQEAVGAPYLWWLRRSESDESLAELLNNPAVAVFVLYWNFQPAGFFELDYRIAPLINLSYFGLMPHAIGKRMGYALLRAAIDRAWSVKPRAVLVNTCNADHPNALPQYKRAGFEPYRTSTEIWDIPVRLGLQIPDHLRV
jgi:GNAT superfamily N-acetyltransferase